MTRRVFQRGNRDRNEQNFKLLLDRYGIPYVMQPPLAGFDILVLTNPVQLWEIKNADLKWTLTKSEHARREYCKANGIIYKVIDSLEQAVDALQERK